MIYTCIPYLPGRMYGKAIKDYMKQLPDYGWVLILDHDVMLVQHKWYDICQEAIRNSYVNHTGLYTCVTNKIGCRAQQAEHYLLDPTLNVKTEDMNTHFKIANSLYHSYGNNIFTHRDPRFKFSGLFMLTKIEILKQYMEFPDNKFIGFDTWYYDRVLESGHTTAVLPGLYIYHSYRRLWKND